MALNRMVLPADRRLKIEFLIASEPTIKTGAPFTVLRSIGGRRKPAMPFDAALIGRDVAVTSHDKVVLAVEPLGGNA